MNHPIPGKVLDTTIRLDEGPGVAEGQEAEIRITFVPEPARWTAEVFSRMAGSLVDDRHWEAMMARMRRERRGGEQ